MNCQASVYGGRWKKTKREQLNEEGKYEKTGEFRSEKGSNRKIIMWVRKRRVL